MSVIEWIKGCLPFTEANRSVDGLGKWYAKFRTAKFHAGIAFTICTNPFHSLRNDHEGLKLVLKKALKQWNTNFCLECSIRKNRLPFQLFRCSRKFSLQRPKKSYCVPFTFQPGFTETFWHGKQSVNNQSLIDYKYIWTAMLTSTLALRVHITPKLKKG